MVLFIDFSLKNFLTLDLKSFVCLDIQFWRQRESLEGLSVRSVFFNVFQSLIVLLYVLDHETNTLIRISCFIGLGIEVWKIHKVCSSDMFLFS